MGRRSETVTARITKSADEGLTEFADEHDMTVSELVSHLLEGFVADQDIVLDRIDAGYAAEIRNQRRRKQSQQMKRAAYFEKNVEEELHRLLSAEADPSFVRDALEIRVGELEDLAKSCDLSDDYVEHLRNMIWQRYQQYQDAYEQKTQGGEVEDPFGVREDVRGSKAYRTMLQNFSDELAEGTASNSVHERVRKHGIREAPEGMTVGDVMSDIEARAYSKILDRIEQATNGSSKHARLVKRAKKYAPYENATTEDVLNDVEMMDGEDPMTTTPPAAIEQDSTPSIQPTPTDGGTRAEEHDRGQQPD